LKIAIVQCDIAWENPSENCRRLSALLAKNADVADILVLPEMFATGFSMNASEVVQAEDGEIMQWLKHTAKKMDSAIIAGVASMSGEDVVAQNNAIWISPAGRSTSVAKRHLFRVAGEHKTYSKGNSSFVIDYKGWRIRPFVCYDLRFPVWSRNVAWHGAEQTYDYDCAVYIANWPRSRREHWLHLLRARAIENQSYVIGVNRVGTDAKGYSYSGDSAVYSPKGDLLRQCPENGETLEHVLLSKGDLQKYRERFPFVLDADKFQIK